MKLSLRYEEDVEWKRKDISSNGLVALRTRILGNPQKAGKMPKNWWKHSIERIQKCQSWAEVE